MSALRKVLVVDDDPVIATSFDRVLSRDGYVVVTARNGTEALDKLEHGDYDVVYTDIKMPGMDGLELAERVKARRSWTPVVIITGHGTEAGERRAQAAGVTAFLHKPLSPEMIETSARQALEAAPPAATPVTPTHVPAEPAAEPTATAPATAPRAWVTVAMLAAAPFIGLAFIVLLPFVGLATLAATAVRPLFKAGLHRRVGRFLKNVALFVAAPVIGLAYIVSLPFIGLGVLVWVMFGGAKKEAAAK